MYGHTPSIAFLHLPPKDVVNQCLEFDVRTDGLLGDGNLQHAGVVFRRSVAFVSIRPLSCAFFTNLCRLGAHLRVYVRGWCVVVP